MTVSTRMDIQHSTQRHSREMVYSGKPDSMHSACGLMLHHDCWAEQCLLFYFLLHIIRLALAQSRENNK